MPVRAALARAPFEVKAPELVEHVGRDFFQRVAAAVFRLKTVDEVALAVILLSAKRCQIGGMVNIVGPLRRFFKRIVDIFIDCRYDRALFFGQPLKRREAAGLGRVLADQRKRVGDVAAAQRIAVNQTAAPDAAAE